MYKDRFFLLVDLWEFFFRFRVGGTKKNKQKSSENDQLTGHFQSFFFSFSELFFSFSELFFFFFKSPEKKQ